MIANSASVPCVDRQVITVFLIAFISGRGGPPEPGSIYKDRVKIGTAMQYF